MQDQMNNSLQQNQQRRNPQTQYPQQMYGQFYQQQPIQPYATYNQFYPQQQFQKREQQLDRTPQQQSMSSQRQTPQQVTNYPPPNQTISTSQLKPSEIKTDEIIFICSGTSTAFSSPSKDIFTKIHYGNKQFVFLINERDINSNKYFGQDQESNQLSNSHAINQVDTAEYKNRLKVELKFEDIDDIEINLNDSLITLITRQPLKQFKQLDSSSSKKQNQWAMFDFFYKDEMKPLKIIAKYPKDILTKNIHHNNRTSHIEKLKACDTSIYFKNFSVVGSIPQNIMLPDALQQKGIAQTQISNSQMQGAPNQIQMHMGYRNEESQYQSQHQSNFYQQMPIQKDSNDMFYKQPSSRQFLRQKEKFIQPDDESNVSQSQFQKNTIENYTEKELENLFPKVSQEKLSEIIVNYEKKIEPLPQEEKIKKLIDEYKIKQFKNISFTGQQNIRCPHFKCSKQFNKAQSLRNHLKKSHPKLQDIELTVDDFGTFTWNEKALDYCLLLGQIFPQFVKGIVKDMKQRKEIPS